MVVFDTFGSFRWTECSVSLKAKTAALQSLNLKEVKRPLSKKKSYFLSCKKVF